MPEASGVDVQGVLAAARAALAGDAMAVQGAPGITLPGRPPGRERPPCKRLDDDALLAASGATLVDADAVELYVAWQATGGIGYNRDRRNAEANCRRLDHDMGTCRSFCAMDVNGPQAAATRRALRERPEPFRIAARPPRDAYKE